jgi:hypothetical protein
MKDCSASKSETNASTEAVPFQMKEVILLNTLPLQGAFYNYLGTRKISQEINSNAHKNL